MNNILRGINSEENIPPKYNIITTLVCETYKIKIVEKIVINNILYCLYKYINNNIFISYKDIKNVYLVMIDLINFKILKRIKYIGLNGCFDNNKYFILIDLKTIYIYDIITNEKIDEIDIIITNFHEMEENINIYEYKHRKIRLLFVDNQLFLCLFNYQYKVIIINIYKEKIFMFQTYELIGIDFYIGNDELVIVGDLYIYFYNIYNNTINFNKINLHTNCDGYTFELDSKYLNILSNYEYYNKTNKIRITESLIRISSSMFLFMGFIYNTIKKDYKIVSNIINDNKYIINFDKYILLNETNKLGDNLFIVNNLIVYYKLMSYINELNNDNYYLSKYVKYNELLENIYIDKNLNYNLDTSTLIFFYNNNIKYFNMLLNNIMYDYDIKKLLNNVTLEMRKYILEYLFKIKLVDTYEIKNILMKWIILVLMILNIYK